MLSFPSERGDIIGDRFEVVSNGPVAVWVIGRDKKCKSVECGGSHYHCTRCGAVTSMCGHPSEEQCREAREAGRDDPEWCS